MYRRSLRRSASYFLGRSLGERQLWEFEALGDDYQDQGLVFPGEHGQPMRPYTLTGKFERILKRAGLPHIRFHDTQYPSNVAFKTYCTREGCSADASLRDKST
jgi:hypothetical protein